MAYLVEIHCDVRAAGCFSKKGLHPSEIALLSADAARIAERKAVEARWIRMRLPKLNDHYGWVCPSCKTEGK